MTEFKSSVPELNMENGEYYPAVVDIWAGDMHNYLSADTLLSGSEDRQRETAALYRSAENFVRTLIGDKDTCLMPIAGGDLAIVKTQRPVTAQLDESSAGAKIDVVNEYCVGFQQDGRTGVYTFDPDTSATDVGADDYGRLNELNSVLKAAFFPDEEMLQYRNRLFGDVYDREAYERMAPGVYTAMHAMFSALASQKGQAEAETTSR